MHEANAEPMLLFVAIVAAVIMVGIIVRGAVTIAKTVVLHRERMAMIGMGMDPDKVSQGPPLNGSAYPSQLPPNRQFDSNTPELAAMSPRRL
jgi:hypothetical protein